MDKFLTVRELTVLIKNNLESDYRFKNVVVKGEISNLKIHPSGHYYFTLKDEYSRLNCIMFASSVKNLKFQVKDGNKVMVQGSIGVYEGSGNYQMYVTKIEPDGLGLLYLTFEKLKRDLENEGLFALEHKKPLPKYPMRIGVISASQGAAVHDIFTTITRRWPICERILIPSLVQGVNAAPSLVNALKIADEMNFDVIIFGRGGGSLEDLWAFNEEIVARQLYKMKTPVVSGVGHEVDFTISDFVSDRRAPTPTGAAEMVTPNIHEVCETVISLKRRLLNAFVNKYNTCKLNLNNMQSKNIFVSPELLYVNKSLYLSSLTSKLNNAKNELISLVSIKNNDLEKRLILNINMLINNKKLEQKDLKVKINSLINEKINSLNYVYNYKDNLINKFNNYYAKIANSFVVNLSKLDSLSPLKVMARGYSYVSKDDKVIKDINDIKVGDSLKIRLKNGEIEAISQKINKKGG